MRAPGRSEGGREGGRGGSSFGGVGGSGGCLSPPRLGEQRTARLQLRPSPHRPPSLPLPASDAAHTRANSNLRVSALQRGAFSPGPGTRKGSAAGRTRRFGSRGRRSVPALRASGRGGGGESSSPSTPSSLHPLDCSFGRPDAWLRLSRGWGLESLWGAKLVFCIWRERLVPSGRTDGVKGRRAAGARMTAKRGRRNLEKPSRSPEKCVIPRVQTMLYYAALLLSDA